MFAKICFTTILFAGSISAQASNTDPKALVNLWIDVPCTVGVEATNNRNFWLPGFHVPFGPRDRNVGQCYTETFQGVSTNYFPTQTNGKKCVFTAYDQANCNGTSPGRAISFNDVDPVAVNCKPGPFRAAPQLLGISYKVTCP
ncbi:hypothetical protein GLAREA_12565 [Glarea lozoyensis ATCC 20868]|uniref:Uncharacterized protein n=2 Tax=Glarea lozoyensis TaxID=101852 RepID=S3CY93_GLAL2|nr:uncharacterized protein GLAREA_12565 [Glarea lozoyensis ATCC 20868]EHK96546.1 hypothetical protein M7I_7755 [Glarea lozoyensis 74030]EPE31262.1 hypothetical protein GLAREA_12565 [Glarea lozoyensis ATCC 20868]